MVSSENGQPFFEPDFDAEQQTDSFNRVVASIDIIPQKEVVGVRNSTSYFEQFHQIVELSVDVTANIDRRPHVDHIGFLCEDLSG